MTEPSESPFHRLAALPRARRWAVIAALALPILILSSPFLFTSRCLYGRDFATYFRSHAILAKDAVDRDDAWPRWNERQYAGTPYLGDLQCSLHYPPHLLFLVMSPERAYGILFALHMAIAAGGLYRLTRFLGARRDAGLLAGIAYSVSFPVAAAMTAGHLTPYITPALTPLVLLLALRLCRRPAPGEMAGLAVAIGAVLLGGMPQFHYHLLLLGGALVAWKTAEARRESRPWRPILVAAAAAAALGFALASISLLPAFEVARHATRTAGSSFYDAEPISRAHAFIPENLISFFIPRFPWTRSAADLMNHDFWHEKAVYIGVLPLLLAGVALLNPKRGPVLYFGIAAGLALLDAAAHDLPFHSALSLLPGYGAYRVPARAVWVTVLSLCVLAALGWSDLADGRLSPHLVRRYLGVLGGAALVGVVAVCWKYRIFGESILFLTLLALSGSALLFARSHPRMLQAGILLTVADLCFFTGGAVSTVLPEEYARPPWYAQHIGPERNDYRLLDLTGFEQSPAAHGFRLLRGYGFPQPAGLPRLMSRAFADAPSPSPDTLSVGSRWVDPEVLNLLNVRWLVTAGSPPADRWTPRGQDGGRTLYENREARPRAFLHPAGPPLSIQTRTDTIQVGGRSSSPGTLILSESWMPGWKATLQGREIAPRLAFDALMAVDVPAGDWEVILRYDPGPWRTGRILSIGAGLGLAALLIAARRKLRFPVF